MPWPTRDAAARLRCAYLAATAGASVAGALELKRRATMQLIISGRVDEGLAALQSVLAALGMALPRSAAAVARLADRAGAPGCGSGVTASTAATPASSRPSS